MKPFSLGIKMALEAKLGNEFGSLADVVPRFKKGTWRTSVELSKERVINEKLRDIWFWTANFGMYTVEDDEEFLYFGGRPANPIFNNIVEAARQLREEQNYKPTADEIKLVKDSVKAGHTVKVKLSDLGLIVDTDEWSHFSIDVNNWQGMSAVQKLFAERIYGSMQERVDQKTGQKTSDFAEYMSQLSEAGKKVVNVYVLNQKYVRAHVPKGGAVARACRLDDFGLNSAFLTFNRIVGNYGDALRGVLLVKAAGGGDARKIDYKGMARQFNVPEKGFDAKLVGRMLTSEGAKNLTATLGEYLAQTKP